VKVIIPGISGLLARIVARRLLAEGHEVIGIDARPWPDAPKGLTVHTLDIRKRAAEEIFRKVKPDWVIHMATVTHLRDKSEDRYRINLGGTRAVFDYCHAHGVGRVVFVGRHTYYGAASDAPLYHTEAEPPIAGTTFPELADLVAADLYAGSALWRYPELTTSVLRVCYTLGPSRHGTLAAFLAGPRVPMVLGFDPLFQFMHEDDAARAICLTVEKGLRGVYNVAGPPPIPLSMVVRATGRTPVPVPEFLLSSALGRFGLPRLSSGARTHVKYPIVIDASLFKKETGFHPDYDEHQTLAAFRAACPAPPSRLFV
jgi:UDP-glucose 4-epimerase